MNDSKIRKAVHGRVVKHYHRSSRALVLDELGVNHGKSRIDVAVINGALYGYEIKSQLDDLSRLPLQVQSYNQVFSRLTLVVAERLSVPALDVIPAWWGVIVVNSGPRDGVILDKIRPASNNPTLDPHAIARLLWREEAADLLRSVGLFDVKLQKKKRSVLYERLVDAFDMAALQDHVCCKLRARQNWRGLSQPS